MATALRILTGNIGLPPMACLMADGSIDERATPIVHPVEYLEPGAIRDMYDLYKCNVEGVAGWSERDCRELVIFWSQKAISEDENVFEVREVQKSKSGGRGAPRVEDIEADVAEIVLTTQHDMDIILRLSAEGTLQDREGNVFKVTEKVAAAFTDTSNYAYQEVAGLGDRLTEQPRETWEDSAERLAAAIEHDPRLGPLIPWPDRAANDTNVLLAGGKICVWLAAWNGKQAHKIRFRLKDTSKYSALLSMDLEKKYFPNRTNDYKTSEWPRRAPPSWVVVRPGAGAPTIKVSPTQRSRVLYLEKTLTAVGAQTGGQSSQAQGGGGRNSGTGGPMGRPGWGPSPSSANDKAAAQRDTSVTLPLTSPRPFL